MAALSFEPVTTRDGNLFPLPEWKMVRPDQHVPILVLLQDERDRGLDGGFEPVGICAVRILSIAPCSSPTSRSDVAPSR